ncbi:hypothetical protein [Pseudovibrio sp. POLY-S9]|uniref:hypothetical protein n=1 Tax=Pseudovibrio sp. POLY-S9 TaxID=1576596 RepID=UPI001AD90122|nr:hypothetical protein [Pseudovibrio sp. POLY-S9]
MNVNERDVLYEATQPLILFLLKRRWQNRRLFCCLKGKLWDENKISSPKKGELLLVIAQTNTSTIMVAGGSVQNAPALRVAHPTVEIRCPQISLFKDLLYAA